MTVFEYIEECTDTEENMNKYYANKDGNLMVLAINAMQEKGDFKNFVLFAIDDKFHDTADFIAYLINPANFFELMKKWLKEKETIRL